MQQVRIDEAFSFHPTSIRILPHGATNQLVQTHHPLILSLPTGAFFVPSFRTLICFSNDVLSTLPQASPSPSVGKMENTAVHFAGDNTRRARLHEDPQAESSAIAVDDGIVNLPFTINCR